MKFKETELLILYLLFDLTLLNVAICVVSCISKWMGWEYPAELNIYVLHANLSWLITYFVFSKKTCTFGMVFTTVCYASAKGF